MLFRSPFPIAAFVGTLVTDVVFAMTNESFWAAMSFYLLSAGLVMAALAAVVGFIDFSGDRLVRRQKAAWHHMIGNIVVVLLQVANWLTREGPDNLEILPSGLLLSAAASVVLLYTGWRGWELVYRHRTGVCESGRG